MNRITNLLFLSSLFASFCACSEPATKAEPDAAIETYFLTVSVAGEGSAEVQVGETLCEEFPCAVSFAAGEVAGIEVRPNLDSRFERWTSGPCTETECELTIQGDEEIEFALSARGELLSQNIISGIVSPVDVVPDQEGNSYIAGQFLRGVPFSEQVLPDQIRGYVAKMSPDGAPQWAHSFSRTDLISVDLKQGSVVLGPNGEVYIIGHGVHTASGHARVLIKRLSTETGDALWSGTVFQESDGGRLDFAAATVDVDGTLLLGMHCRGQARLTNINVESSDQEAICMAAFGADGDVLRFEVQDAPGSGDVELGSNLLALADGGSMAMVVTGDTTTLYEFGATGEVVGTYPTGLPADIAAGELGQTPDGNLIVVATFGGDLTWGDDELLRPGSGLSERFVGKMTPRGLPLSANRLGGTDTLAKDLIFKDDGSFWLVARRSGQNVIDFGNGPYADGVGFGVAAFTDDGQLRWDRGFALDGDILTLVPGEDTVDLWAGVRGSTTTELGELLPHDHADHLEGGTKKNSPVRFLIRD